MTDLLFRKIQRRELIAKLFKVDLVKPTAYRLYEWFLKHRHMTIALLILILVWQVVMAAAMYNDFINLRQEVVAARADIESCLQMRENLIPQLVVTVGDFVKHEDTVFLHSADVRAKSINPAQDAGRTNQPEQKRAGTDSFHSFVSKLFAIAERYPELKTSESFQSLMSRAAEVEREIVEKRINYNYKAYKMNRKVTSFPEIIYAGLFGFKQVEYFRWNGEPEWVSRRVGE